MLFPRRPVSKIILMPVVGKALVLSDGTLSFFTLPTLDPVPSALINPIRGVVTAVIDDAEMDADTDKPAEMGLCVIKRKSIMLFRLGARLMTDKVSVSTLRWLICRMSYKRFLFQMERQQPVVLGRRCA